MYVYQSGKLYTQHGNKLVGVDFTPSSIIMVEGTETDYEKEFALLTAEEVKCKFNIHFGFEYKFPRPEKVEEVVEPVIEATQEVVEPPKENKSKEVVKSGTATATKGTTRKPASKR